MKTELTKMTSSEFVNAILPPFGTPLSAEFKKPRWIPGMKFWLINEYLKQDNGNYYFDGIRLAGNIIIKMKIGEWKTWTYLDELEIWAFDGTSARLINKKQYSKEFHKEEKIRAELEFMLGDYLKGQAKLYGQTTSDEEIKTLCRDMIERSSKDFLDKDYELALPKIVPMLMMKN